MEKTKSKRGKDYTTSEMLDLVIFLGTEEKTKDEIREGLNQVFKGRQGDPVPGFMTRVKQALTKEGTSGLSTRVAGLKGKKVCYYKLNISEDEAADRLQNFKGGRKNMHTAHVVVKKEKKIKRVVENVVEQEDIIHPEDPIVPILKKVLEFFDKPEVYTPDQLKALLDKLPEDIYDYWFEKWASIQREKLEEKLSAIRNNR